MYIKQYINNIRATTLEQTEPKLPKGGLNAFYWRQIFVLDFIFVNTQTLFSAHGSFLTNAMHHHREKI